MTKNDILSELFLSKDFRSCISKMEPAHLQEDLKGEVMLILCEYNPDKIQELYAEGKLKFFTVRIILNLIRSKTSKFYKTYRKQEQNISISENTGDNETPFQLSDEQTNWERTKQNMESDALDAIESLYWYDKEIVKLYLKHGNYRAVEEVTGIPFESIYKTVQRSAKLIYQGIKVAHS